MERGCGRQRRHYRIRKKMSGDEKKPRLVVFRSNKHIYGQIVNDFSHKVLLTCSTLMKELNEKNTKVTKRDSAKQVGQLIAQKMLTLGIKEVCFDRGGYKYHGRVKALADGAREGGLKF